jgi:hypothetical protein
MRQNKGSEPLNKDHDPAINQVLCSNGMTLQ